MEGGRIVESAAAERAMKAQPAQSRPLVVSKIETLTADGRSASTFHPGEAMTVRIHVHAEEAAAEWTTGISIDNSMGQMDIASNPDRRDRNIPAITAGAT